MGRGAACLTATAGLALALAGCQTGLEASLFADGAAREAWREVDEQACMARRPSVASATLKPLAPISGPGACGTTAPLEVSGLVGGSIVVSPTATLGCPAVEATEAWLTNSVQPAAMAWFGSTVVEIRQLSNYACRRPRGWRPGKLSEHSYGNAFDVAEFKLASGRVVTVQNGWRGGKDEQAFLREIAVTACQYFKTFLGPGVAFHHNHFHVDLAHRGDSGTDRYCRPVPEVVPPARVPVGQAVVAVTPAKPGALLTEMPADVAAEIDDPFGVADPGKEKAAE